MHKYFFRSKMVLDIHKGVEDMYKAKKDEEGADLKEEVVAASTGQSVHREANRSTDYTNNGNLKFRFDKSKVKCYNCQKLDHYARDCWNPYKRVKENANLVIEEEKKTTILLVHDERIQDKESMWYLNNGASNHICGDK